jgi:hypothetical protein
MATEGHKFGRGTDHKKKRKEEIDKELREIREKMENLALKMQQETKTLDIRMAFEEESKMACSKGCWPENNNKS